MRFGSLVILVLGGMDLGMRQQQECSGLLTSSHTHTPCAHGSLSGINKESAHTILHSQSPLYWQLYMTQLYFLLKVSLLRGGKMRLQDRLLKSAKRSVPGSGPYSGQMTGSVALTFRLTCDR